MIQRGSGLFYFLHLGEEEGRQTRYRCAIKAGSPREVKTYRCHLILINKKAGVLALLNFSKFLFYLQ